jgi:transposase InsO family protein
MNVYPFIEAEKAEQDGNVATACVLLKVSRSAYYEWSKHIFSQRDLSDADLGDKIVDIHTKSRGTYGAPRIITKLAEAGICVGQKRVARLMVRRGLIGRCKRRFKVTTTPDPDAGSLAPDLIKRAFAPEAHELDVAWCGDITYIRTWEGWLYLATVIDLASRRVVGFAMADHMRADLVCDALEMAIQGRRPAAGLKFHSDRGSQGEFNRWSQHPDYGGVRRWASPSSREQRGRCEASFGRQDIRRVGSATSDSGSGSRSLEAGRARTQRSAWAWHPRSEVGGSERLAGCDPSVSTRCPAVT